MLGDDTVVIDDIIIIGSGVSALRLATLLPKEMKVRILTKARLETTNSYLAQGGIAVALSEEDSPEKHLKDTLDAGRYHQHDVELVRDILTEAPTLIQEIMEIFDRNEKGEVALGLEGAHSEKRIVHSGGDATGKNVSDYFIEQLSGHVHVEEFIFAYELIVDRENNRCVGVKAKSIDGKIYHFFAQHIVLATGGCGQLYPFTSNAKTITGDGIAMAYLAGAEVVDMEFIQFHPTLLYIDGEAKGLVSEAVRGEGAVLITADGTPIMEGVHPLKDLAPRHIVSQTIYHYREQGQEVYLDISSIPNFADRFPSITNMCKNYGVDLEEGKIPVVPGSHFLMGGIKTDGIGRTSIPGLYAIGEAACTGFHGANRLASNSLLEGLYQGKKLAIYIQSQPREKLEPMFPPVITGSEKTILLDREILKANMLNNVGIIRTNESLKKQKQWLDQFDVTKFTNLDSYSIEEITTIFMYITASLITNAALERTESRGGHFRSDFPYEDKQWEKKVIIQKRDEGWMTNEQVKTKEVTGTFFY